MITLPDRQMIVESILESESLGLSHTLACRENGISVRTLQRWQRKAILEADGRSTVCKKAPRNKLSEEEEAQVLKVCHEPEFASLPPSQIVPILADRGEYLVSESSIYRMLRRAGEQNHRGRAKHRQSPKPKSSHCAVAPCQVWSWDITWLKSPVRGLFYYLYLVIDIFSRKIVAWEVYEKECSIYASDLMRRAVLSERLIDKPLILHSDNGGPQRGSTLRQTLTDLGIDSSYSRPRVSNDNPYSEAIFRTCKYRPAYPEHGFKSLEDARNWIMEFVLWYNTIHRHSSIQFVTPQQRHEGLDVEILAARSQVYAKAKLKNPNRWSGSTRNWDPVQEVWLNPDKTTSDSNRKNERTT